MEDLALMRDLRRQGSKTQHMAVDPDTREVAEQTEPQPLEVPEEVYGAGDVDAITMGVVGELDDQQPGAEAAEGSRREKRHKRRKGKEPVVAGDGSPPTKRSRRAHVEKEVPDQAQLSVPRTKSLPVEQRTGSWTCLPEELQEAVVADALDMGPELLKIQHNSPAENKELLRRSIFRSYQIMNAVNKREQEMALADNYHKLQQAHEYLKGERKQVARERDSYKKKYEKVKAQSQKDSELAAAKVAGLEMKVSQLPELEKEVAAMKAAFAELRGVNAELEEKNVYLGEKVTELALAEVDAGPRAVREFLASPEYQQRLKEEREAFMRRKVQEWADAEWLDVEKMLVEATQKAEAEKAAQAAQAAVQATPSAPQEAAGDEEVAAAEEEEEEEEPLRRRRVEAAAEVAGEEEVVAEGEEEEVQSRGEGIDVNALD